MVSSLFRSFVVVALAAAFTTALTMSTAGCCHKRSHCCPPHAQAKFSSHADKKVSSHADKKASCAKMCAKMCGKTAPKKP